jgi:hypothetical protein
MKMEWDRSGCEFHGKDKLLTVPQILCTCNGYQLISAIIGEYTRDSHAMSHDWQVRMPITK